jgi:hypothetical protein
MNLGRIAGAVYFITFVAGVIALVSTKGRLAANLIVGVNAPGREPMKPARSQAHA